MGWPWPSRAFGIFGIEAGRPGLHHEPVDHCDLAEAEQGQEKPGETFAEPEPSLAGGGEPEAESEGAHLDQVAVAERGLEDGLAVDRREGLRLGGEMDAGIRTEIEFKMAIPYAVVVQAKIAFGGAPDPERKTAGHLFGARLLSVQNSELDHSMGSGPIRKSFS